MHAAATGDGDRGIVVAVDLQPRIAWYIAPLSRVARSQGSRWVYLVVAVLAVLVILYLLQGAP